MLFSKVTHGILVTVEPEFLRMEKVFSDNVKYFWKYTASITNNGKNTVQLIHRQWTIIDVLGKREEVFGQGVVGKMPIFEPEQSFSYDSLTFLSIGSGIMYGNYHFIDIKTKQMFWVEIPAFPLEQDYEHLKDSKYAC